jgi:hypothetical protein
VVKKEKTPVLAADEARALLDSVEVTTLTGLRDRALIGMRLMVRCSRVIVKDYKSYGLRDGGVALSAPEPSLSCPTIL